MWKVMIRAFWIIQVILHLSVIVCECLLQTLKQWCVYSLLQVLITMTLLVTNWLYIQYDYIYNTNIIIQLYFHCGEIRFGLQLWLFISIPVFQRQRREAHKSNNHITVKLEKLRKGKGTFRSSPVHVFDVHVIFVFLFINFLSQSQSLAQRKNPNFLFNKTFQVDSGIETGYIYI